MFNVEASSAAATFNIEQSTLNIQVWCERRDSNPHGFGPLDPKSSASANSATFACGTRSLKQKSRQHRLVVFFGAPTRTRTWNQQIKSLLLYQLSYGGRT